MRIRIVEWHTRPAMNALTSLQALLLRGLLTGFALTSPVALAQSLLTNAPGVAQALVQAEIGRAHV